MNLATIAMIFESRGGGRIANLKGVGWSDVYMLPKLRLNDNLSKKGYSTFFCMVIGPRVSKGKEDTEKMAHTSFTPSRDPAQCALLAVIREMIFGFSCGKEDRGMRTADMNEPQTVANMGKNPATRMYKPPGWFVGLGLIHFGHPTHGRVLGGPATTTVHSVVWGCSGLGLDLILLHFEENLVGC